MYCHMQDLWGPRNLVASVTAWSNRNRYSIVVVGGRMRYLGQRQGRMHTVEPIFHPECRGAISTSEGLSKR
jgi:hypothetical protein